MKDHTLKTSSPTKPKVNQADCPTCSGHGRIIFESEGTNKLFQCWRCPGVNRTYEGCEVNILPNINIGDLCLKS